MNKQRAPLSPLRARWADIISQPREPSRPAEAAGNYLLQSHTCDCSERSSEMLRRWPKIMPISFVKRERGRGWTPTNGHCGWPFITLKGDFQAWIYAWWSHIIGSKTLCGARIPNEMILSKAWYPAEVSLGLPDQGLPAGDGGQGRVADPGWGALGMEPVEERASLGYNAIESTF